MKSEVNQVFLLASAFVFSALVRDCVCLSLWVYLISH